MEDLNQRLSASFARHATAPALVTDDGQVVSYGRMEQTVARFASRAIQEGIRADNRVVVLVDNTAVRLMMWLALLRIGAVPVLAETVEMAQAAGVNVDQAIALPDQVAPVATVLFGQDWAKAEVEPVHASARGVFVGSSGSTGAPKFMYRSAESLLDLIAHRNGFAGAVGLNAGVLIGIAPGQAFSLQQILAAFLAGTCASWPVGSPLATLERMETFGMTELLTSPLLLAQLVDAAEKTGRAPRIRRIACGGAATPIDLLKRAGQVFGADIFCLMGTSESGFLSGHALKDGPLETGELGALAKGVEARIFSPNADGDGALAFRVSGQRQIQAYADGQRAVDAQGWCQTGDIARWNDRGRIVILSRQDERINLGGEKLTPAKAEALFQDIAAGQPLAALEVSTPAGAALGLAMEGDLPQPAKALEAQAQTRLGIGARVLVRAFAAFPQTRSGKLDRRALRAEFETLQKP